jgi:hypothetical protein
MDPGSCLTAIHDSLGSVRRGRVSRAYLSSLFLYLSTFVRPSGRPSRSRQRLPNHNERQAILRNENREVFFEISSQAINPPGAGAPARC